MEINAGLDAEGNPINWDKFKNFAKDNFGKDGQGLGVAGAALSFTGDVIDKSQRDGNTSRPASGAAQAFKKGGEWAALGAMSGNPFVTGGMAVAGATIGIVQAAQEKEDYMKMREGQRAKKQKNDYLSGREHVEIAKNKAHELYTS